LIELYRRDGVQDVLMLTTLSVRLSGVCDALTWIGIDSAGESQAAATSPVFGESMTKEESQEFASTPETIVQNP